MYHKLLYRISSIYKAVTGYHAINGLDKKLEQFVNYDNGFYVELGANDGIKQSNTLYFEKKRNWKGILIEPSSNNFIKCTQNRNPQNKFFCNACVSFDYKKKYLDMMYVDLMSISAGLDLDLPDQNQHVVDGKNFLHNEELIHNFGAVAATLDSLLIEAGAPEVIDFLSLDVEGAEVEVLNGINYDRFTFRYMLIETRNFQKVSKLLTKHKYRFEQKLSAHDYLFSFIF